MSCTIRFLHQRREGEQTRWQHACERRARSEATRSACAHVLTSLSPSLFSFFSSLSPSSQYMKLNSELGAVIRGKQGENAASAAFSKKAVIIGTGKGSPQEISN